MFYTFPIRCVLVEHVNNESWIKSVASLTACVIVMVVVACDEFISQQSNTRRECRRDIQRRCEILFDTQLEILFSSEAVPCFS